MMMIHSGEIFTTVFFVFYDKKLGSPRFKSLYLTRNTNPMKTFLRTLTILFIINGLCASLYGQQVPQNKKTLQAVRTAVAPRIDGRSADMV